MVHEPNKDIILKYSSPLEPIPTGQPAKLQSLADVRSVLFDIYGTLLISSSGDREVLKEQIRAAALAEALAAFNVQLLCDPQTAVECFLGTVDTLRGEMHRQGIEYPEVDIVDVWQRTLREMDRQGWIDTDPGNIAVRRLAVEFEVRANPVWPMPMAGQCLRDLSRRGMLLGLVSNAQFLTPDLLRTLLEPGDIGFPFDPELQYYSFEHGHAKPGQYLFSLAVATLARRGIQAQQALYVGNDMLNDMLPARLSGFRTALFAGDARSFRPRDSDPRVAGIKPDLVVTDLLQIVNCTG